ncbi:MAG TPA: DUF2959 family protein [Verrucomicrobiae bacterium]|nr:DUF2959 family protein [Verrucomicrobiae bacterium]
MKKSNALKFMSNLALATALAVIAGCASGNYQKGNSTASGLTDSANKIAEGNTKIDATLSSLSDLVNNPQGDLVSKFNKFNSALKDLQSSAADVKARVAEMRKTGNEYFAQWDQQLAAIKNEDIKSRSADRKAEVQKEFSDIKRSYTQVQMAYEPFISDLKDVQTALSTDLTVGGVTAIKGAADKANKDAAQLKSAMSDLSTQFKELGVAMAANAPAPQTGDTNAPAGK